MSTHEISSLESHLGYWLRFVSSAVSRAFAEKVEAEGVTVAEWVVLREVYTEDTAPSVIAERIGMTRGAVTKIVDRLEEKELIVQRAGNGDRRYRRIGLTDNGKSLVPRLAQIADANDEEFFGYLTDKQRRELIETMQGIVRRQGLKTVPTE